MPAKKRVTKTQKAKVNCSAPQSEENIKEKAYFIWESKGYPENSAIDNWVEAESQLMV